MFFFVYMNELKEFSYTCIDRLYPTPPLILRPAKSLNHLPENFLNRDRVQSINSLTWRPSFE